MEYAIRYGLLFFIADSALNPIIHIPGQQIHATKDPSPHKRCILLMKIKNTPAIILANP